MEPSRAGEAITNPTINDIQSGLDGQNVELGSSRWKMPRTFSWRCKNHPRSRR